MTDTTVQFDLSTVFRTVARAVPEQPFLVWRDLRLTYAHAPLLPVTAALLRALAPETGRAYADRIWRAGLLPIVAEARMTMQSHPVRWKHGTQRVGTAAADAGASGRRLLSCSSISSTTAMSTSEKAALPRKFSNTASRAER